jgi:hypothetical protein
VAETFAHFQAAELRGSPQRTLDRLGEAYLAEVATYQAAATRLAQSERDVP